MRRWQKIKTRPLDALTTARQIGSGWLQSNVDRRWFHPTGGRKYTFCTYIIYHSSYLLLLLLPPVVCYHYTYYCYDPLWVSSFFCCCFCCCCYSCCLLLVAAISWLWDNNAWERQPSKQGILAQIRRLVTFRNQPFPWPWANHKSPKRENS